MSSIHSYNGTPAYRPTLLEELPVRNPAPPPPPPVSGPIVGDNGIAPGGGIVGAGETGPVGGGRWGGGGGGMLGGIRGFFHRLFAASGSGR
ncbi:MAG TPA: hypothetical protein VFH51_04010 [Myxococcota bacterium]|nr:hypothetical protein [Myxococcota bacterium]